MGRNTGARKPWWRSISVAVLPVALVVAGCGGGGSTGGGGAGDGAISVFGTEPENPLVPGNTNEVGGGRVVDALFTRLFSYDSENAEPRKAMAESVETTDSKVFTIKIKQGWKFHDGTEVKAKNFVDAWNTTAYGPNGYQNASFFEQVQGYDDVHPADPDGRSGPQQPPEPRAKEMSGLKVLDDYSFEVTLKEPFSVFPTKLGYSAYSPLPDAFFSDREAFEKHPIGNGPFEFVSRQVNAEIKLRRFEGYQGEDKPKVKDLTFRIYQSMESAYQDILAGTLDFMEQVPPAALAGGKYRTDLPDRYLEKDTLVIANLSFPQYRDEFTNPDLRRAISMAINRKEITERIFEGTRKPATGWAAPGLKGYQPNQCGEFCEYDPEKAKEYLAKSGYSGKITIQSNSDGGHKEWIEATCNSIKNTLGLDCVFTPTTSFGEFRQLVNSHQMVGPYRTGWKADYPSIENFLNPLYRTGASSNDNGYTNPELDAKLAEADRATDEDQATKLYQEAERMLAKDMATIPLWTYTSTSGFSDRVTNVKVSPLNELDLGAIQVK
ncbi:peptide ABC transporter substrate-binding protein [Longimycelium tulufanense]|uniref:Peptide ABC transporter substrate-binding protein n=1 Tax=Longimycelium tulufanense TaxID=907463 RepID=A0A8J3FWQ8_9PSEU|nr:ABC transporter substrate-binding protein [Longimycelium tulufanense]GGM68486.1 peptide ABC transporter substrate-binding protein [Longimycelium tulufanense]